MGGFVSSPYQSASEQLYRGALAGQPIGADALRRMTAEEVTGLRQTTSARLGEVGGDILSRAASAGFAPSSGVEAMIGRASAPILASEQSAESQLMASYNQDFLNLLMQQLFTGMKGLSTSSPMGDILSSLTSLANLAQGGVGLISGLKKMGTSTGNSTGIDVSGAPGLGASAG